MCGLQAGKGIYFRRSSVGPCGIVGDENASRAPARFEWSCAMQQHPQTPSLDERLIRDSQNLRKQAEGMPAGVARDDLLRKARQAETRVSTVLEWLSSPGLRPPK